MPFSSGAAPCQICTTRCTVMPTYCSLMLSPWAKLQMLRYPQLFRRSALSLVLKPTVRFQIFPPVTFSNSTCRCCLPGTTTAWLALLKAWSCSCRFNGVSLMAVFTYPSKHFYSTTACRATETATSCSFLQLWHLWQRVPRSSWHKVLRLWQCAHPVLSKGPASCLIFESRQKCFDGTVTDFASCSLSAVKPTFFCKI